MEIIAHRGVHNGAIWENTITAFEKAVKLDCRWMELDCCLTKDNILVVTHGGWAIAQDRVIFIKDRTLEELVTLGVVADSMERRGKPKRQMPTLELVLRNFIRRIRINIELKNKGSASVLYGTLRKMLEEEPLLWPWFKYRLIVSSFICEEAADFKKLYPDIETAISWDGLNFSRRLKMLSLACTMSKFNIEGIQINHRIADKEIVPFFKNRGYKVRVYTVNDGRLIPALLNLGVDGIFTDRVEFMRRQLAEVQK